MLEEKRLKMTETRLELWVNQLSTAERESGEEERQSGRGLFLCEVLGFTKAVE